MFISMITTSADFIVAILGLHFPQIQSVPSTNVDAGESAFVALLLRLVTAANEER